MTLLEMVDERHRRRLLEDDELERVAGSRELTDKVSDDADPKTADVQAVEAALVAAAPIKRVLIDE